MKLPRLTVKEEIHLQENTFLDLWDKVKRNAVQFPLHHVTYSALKFEVATSNSLGGNTFTRNVTNRQTDERRTDFGTILMYPFFSLGGDITMDQQQNCCLRTNKPFLVFIWNSEDVHKDAIDNNTRLKK